MDKECRDCRIVKPIEQYYYYKATGVHHSYCSKCSNKRSNESRKKSASGSIARAKWRNNNREHVNAQQRAYRASKRTAV